MRASLLLIAAATLSAQTPDELFEAKVRPLFAERCVVCHDAKNHMGDLDLSAPGVDPSRLMAAVEYEGKVKMPPTGKLDEAEIEALRQWTAAGAPWPEKVKADREAEHWAFQPITDPVPPEVRDVAWVRNPIDRFVLARLEEAELRPAPEAEKFALLRRAKFDLLGLPPTVSEIDEFLADESPEAFAKLIDRLLSSPQYGERWGRHWLDVARYADSTGVDEDHPYPHAWRYRDYVVEAFNSDLPYDQFVREQIAGDLLPSAEPGAINTRGIIATGFLALGPKALAQRDPIQKKYNVVDEQIDTVSKAFLGLTIACSRCHDHKFDPILTSDYYALASIFAGTRSYVDWKRNGSESYSAPLVPDEVYEPYRKHQERLSQAKRILGAANRLRKARYLLEEQVPQMTTAMKRARGGHFMTGPVDEAVQAKWNAFLRPRPDAPSYLKEWHDADNDGAVAFAEARRLDVEKTLTAHVTALESWLPGAETAFNQGEEFDAKPISNLPVDSFLTGLTEDGGPYDVDAKDIAARPDDRSRAERLQAQVEELERTAPPQPAMANAVAEGESVEQHVFIRGNYNNPGDLVAKRFPIVLAGKQQPPVEGSGRRELADWLASPKNPLTARVMANRIWQGHFGEGIVRTPSNFGKVGERPTHPELLDYLASRFIESGWSVKAMHRLIMTSNAYRMSAAASEEAWSRDADGRLLSRFERRRLSLEEIRDSYLFLEGALDLTVGGNLDVGSGELTEFQRNNRRLNPDDFNRRSLYLPLMRNKLPTLLTLFDFGDAANTMARRTTTNVAPQALYLMNSEFAARAARGFSRRVLAEPVGMGRRIDLAYRMALARPATEAEKTAVKEFLADFERDETSEENAELAAWKSFCKMLMASNEFHYVE